jgi:hypothetical protein
MRSARSSRSGRAFSFSRITSPACSKRSRCSSRDMRTTRSTFMLVGALATDMKLTPEDWAFLKPTGLLK